MFGFTRSIGRSLRQPLLIAAAFALVSAPVLHAEPVNPFTQFDTPATPAQAQPANPLAQLDQPTPAQPVNPLAQVTQATPAQPVNPLAQVTQPTPAQPVNPLIQVNPPAPAPSQPVNPLPPQTPTAAAAALTIEQIGQALNEYGKNTITNDGETYYKLNITRGDWRFVINVSLSPNGKFIWLTAPLTTVTDLDKASAAALANLLVQNGDLGPSFFQMVGPRHQISLTRPVPNYAMTPELLRAHIESMLETIQKTEPLWKQQTLNPQGASQAAVNPLGN